MSELSVGDINSGLKDYRSYLEGKMSDFKHEITEHWETTRFLQDQFKIEINADSEVEFSIPALEFMCKSSCRIVFLEKLPLAEVRFTSDIEDEPLTIETYYFDIHGMMHVGTPGSSHPVNFEFENISQVVFSSIVKAASIQKLISL